MGIEMFCNFVEESIHEAAFLQPIWAMKLRPRATTEEFGIRNIRTIFPFLSF
jgi:hypothetical protein